MKVAIVIPTLNEEKTIGKLVDSLVEDPHPDKEIIVVDGGSTDDTVGIAKRHGAVVLKEVGKSKCPANARNQGVEKSHAGVICIMDGDTDHVGRYFVTNAIRHFKDPSVIGVLCKTTFIRDTLVAKGLISANNSSLTKFSAQALEHCGQNFTFLKMEVFKELGGYPMLGVGEDVMLGRKLGDYMKANPSKKIINEPSSASWVPLYGSFTNFLMSRIWYGRTKIPYLKRAGLNSIRKCILLLYPTAYLFSIVSIPLVLASHWFLISASPYLIRLFLICCESIKNRDKHRLLTPLIDIINGIGHTIGLAQYLCGHRSLSRGLPILAGGEVKDCPWGKTQLTRRDRTFEMLGEVSGNQILDVGCGDGFVSRMWAKKNEVHGIDISAGALVRAASFGIKTKRWDIRKGLPFESGSFDMVLLSEVIEHVFDTDAMLSEVRRVLKEDGVLLLTVPNVCSLVSRIQVGLGRLPSYIEYHCRAGMAGHIRGYNLPTIKKQLMEHGFKIDDIRTNVIAIWRFLIPWRWRPLRSFGEIIIVKGRRGE